MTQTTTVFPSEILRRALELAEVVERTSADDVLLVKRLTDLPEHCPAVVVAATGSAHGDALVAIATDEQAARDALTAAKD